jgi:pilus assembly protein CpaB
MKRRVLAAAAALLLAVAGAAALFAYVSHADQRAMAGQRTASVLVVDKPIPKGTSAAQLSQYVAIKTLPAIAVAPTAVSQVDQLRGQVANADLQPGEQVSKSRFADPASLAAPTSVPVPKGMQEVSFKLEQQRVVGGTIAAGDTVGAFVTVGTQDKHSHLVLQKVLVTHVDGGSSADSSSGQAKDKQGTAADGSLMVTLAMRGADAEKVVFGAEDGSVWLSKEPANADTTGTRVITEGNVFK